MKATGREMTYAARRLERQVSGVEFDAADVGCGSTRVIVSRTNGASPEPRGRAAQGPLSLTPAGYRQRVVSAVAGARSPEMRRRNVHDVTTAFVSAPEFISPKHRPAAAQDSRGGRPPRPL